MSLKAASSKASVVRAGAYLRTDRSAPSSEGGESGFSRSVRIDAIAALGGGSQRSIGSDPAAAAFELLDELRPSIEWVAGSREAFAALDGGRATMAMTFSGRARKVVCLRKPQEILENVGIHGFYWQRPS